MRTHYNRFAGQSIERLAAISDGIFAVAMTLLVLDLKVPVLKALQSIQNEQPLWTSRAIGLEQALWGGLVQQGFWQSLLTYFMSFLTLGIFWVGQQTQLNQFARSNRNLTWIQLAFLFTVSLMPFSTSFLAAFITFRIALVTYWFNIFLLGAVLYASFHYAKRAGLVKEEITAEVYAAAERRILTAQALYTFGMLLCVISTYASIAFIVLVQLNYAIAPRIRPLDRL